MAVGTAWVSLRNILIRQENRKELTLPDESYDLATAFETIYFWPGLEKCFGQAARILKNAGFSEVTGNHHPSKPWITVVAKK